MFWRARLQLEGRPAGARAEGGAREGGVAPQVHGHADVEEEEGRAGHEDEEGVEREQVDEAGEVEAQQALGVRVRVLGERDERRGGEQACEPGEQHEQARVRAVEDLLDLPAGMARRETEAAASCENLRLLSATLGKFFYCQS